MERILPEVVALINKAFTGINDERFYYIELEWMMWKSRKGPKARVLFDGMYLVDLPQDIELLMKEIEAVLSIHS